MSARDALKMALMLAGACLALAGCDDDETGADAAVLAPDAMGGSDGAVDADRGADADAAVDAMADAMGDATADAGVDAMADASADAGLPLAYAPCAAAERVGSFRIELADGFTGVQGQIANGVNPAQVPVVAASEGECHLLRPPEFFCDPGCGGGTTCGPDGICVAIPSNVDVGAVEITGLRAPVRMSASAPVWFYTNREPLAHPGFDPGDAIRLDAEGNAGDAFTLRGEGIAPLVVEGDVLALQAGEAATLRWQPPPGATAARVHLDLNIANHGGTPARIECEVDDDGEFALPAGLIEQLLGLGFSGFPTVVVTRRTVDHADVALGCVELRVLSTQVLDVLIPGLTSCGEDADCPPGESCQPDLTCG